MNIVYITDENYIEPTCVSAVSLINNSADRDELRICIIGYKVTKVGHAILETFAKEYRCVDIIEMNDCNINDLFQNGAPSHVSPAALIKFNLPDILENVDKVLYLDGDTIIQSDLRDLYDTNIDEMYVAAVEDVKLRLLKKKGVPLHLEVPDNRYFNSGMMLLNLAHIRKDNIKEKLIDYKLHGQNIFVDQDALNMILGTKKVLLSHEYNFMSSLTDKIPMDEVYHEYPMGNMDDLNSYEEYISRAKIVHLTGKMKPWTYNMPWFSDIYRKYYRIFKGVDSPLDLKSPFYPIYDEVKNEHDELARRFIEFQEMESKRKFPQELLVPFNIIKKDSRIVVYGAGVLGNKCIAQLEAFEYGNIVLWVDSDFENKSSNVKAVEEIKNVLYDFILIAVGNVDVISNIKELLVEKYLVAPEKIVTALQWKN